MNLGVSRNKRTAITVFITLLIICEMIVYVTTTPRPSEQFFQLYVLGADHLAAEYYPRNDSNIGIGEPVTWYLGVINNMGSVQLVSIRVKLSNETIEAPNDTSASESPAPVLTDFMRFVENNETWEVPFVWSISNATARGGSTRILILEVDNETYTMLNWTATGGYNFRFTFELWTWQTDTNAFEFGWGAGSDRRVAWLQVWFNMTSPAAPPSA